MTRPFRWVGLGSVDVTDNDNGLGERRRQLAEETARIEESCMYSSQGQFECGKRWRSVNLWLGVPSALLAAISGATGLATTTGRLFAGIAALVAAGLGAVHTTINASQKMTQALGSANTYMEIQTAARQFRLIDLPNTEYDKARQVLLELTARRDETNKTSDAIPRFAYRRAKANILSGGQTHAVDSATEGNRG